MIRYALRCIRERGALWKPALLLAFLAALPGVLVVTVLAPAATVFLLTGDLAVVRPLLPGPLTNGGVLPWLLVTTAAALAAALWVRLYVLLLWISDERKEPAVSEAWRGTRRSLFTAFVLYAEAQLGIVLVLVLLLAFAVFTTPADASGAAALGALTAAIAFRTVIRIALTLALRAAVLDGAPHRRAWLVATTVWRDRRNDVVAAWVALVAVGVAVWLGGRLATPALQDTALAFRHDEAATWAREGAQLLFSVPLEAFLLVVSAGAWTAVYLGGDALRDTPRADDEGREPWIRGALAALVVLVLIGNAVPSVIERRVRAEREQRRSEIAAAEIRPEDARRAARTDTEVSDYDVTARLDGDRLEWTTTIRWRNNTAADVRDLGVQVYPNAFTRDEADIPLAADIMQSPVVRRRLRSGSLEITRVEALGQRVDDYSFGARGVDTALVIPFDDPVAPGETAEVGISLVAGLPRFPERFGTWRGITLLGNWIPVVAPRDGDEWRFDDYGSVGDPFVSETASYRVTLTLEQHQAPVGTGVLVDLRDSGETRTWRFDADETRDAAFAIAPFWRGLERNVGDLLVRAWFPADRSEEGAALIDAATSAASDYTRRFGTLPFDELDVVQTEGVFGGMEYPGTVFVSTAQGILEGFPLLPDLLSHAGLEHQARRYVAGHEVAHQWWYASAGNDQVREPWLDEALAEVSTRLWLRSEDGDDRAWIMTNLSSPVDPPRGVLSTPTTAFDDNTDYTRQIYLGGSELLLRLRDRIGAERFNRLLRTWHERAGGRIGTVAEFLEVTRAVGGRDAVLFLERRG